MDNASKKSNMKVMVRLMIHTGGAFSDVQLEKDGDRGPQHVFCSVNLDDIAKVDNELVEI